MCWILLFWIILGICVSNLTVIWSWRHRIWNQNDKCKLSIRVGVTENVVVAMLRNMGKNRGYTMLLNSNPGLFTVAVWTTSPPQYSPDSRLGSCVRSACLIAANSSVRILPCQETKPVLPINQPKAHHFTVCVVPSKTSRFSIIPDLRIYSAL